MLILLKNSYLFLDFFKILNKIIIRWLNHYHRLKIIPEIKGGLSIISCIKLNAFTQCKNPDFL